MSDNKKEDDFHSSDGEGKFTKEKEEIISEDKTTIGESLSEIDINDEKTSNADSDVIMSEDSTAPVSDCLKETSEICSMDTMYKDIKSFFLNLKELQKKKSSESSKRKIESTLDDLSDKSNLSHSEECIRPAKKLLLDTSTTEVTSFEQSRILTETISTSEVSIPPENAGLLLLSSVISDVTNFSNRAPSDVNYSTESHSSPQTGTSSEDPISTADQSNASEHRRNEDSTQSPQLVTTNRAAEPLAIEYYDQQFVELNGIRSHRFPGTIEVQIIVPLFECFLNDLLELRSFLDGCDLSVTPEEESDAGVSVEVAYSDRQLASISEEFGTGVESETARISKEAVIEWDTKYISKVDSECLSGYSEQSELSEDYSLSGSSSNRMESESNSNEIPDSFPSPNLSPDPNPESDVAALPTKTSQLSPDVGHSLVLESKEEPSTTLQCTESEFSSDKIPEKATTPPLSSEPVPTDSLRFHAELDHLNLPSDVSPLLRGLNAEGLRLLNSCIETSKNFLRTCLLNGTDSFQGTLLEHMRGMLDTMRRLISIREECSDLLKNSPDKNSVAGIVHILKVKYYIAKVYNQLLDDILAMNTNFHEVVKDKLPLDAVD